MNLIDGQLARMESDTENANQIKNIVIQQLYNDGILDENQAKEYGFHRHMIIVKPSWFSALLKRFGYNVDSNYMFQYVRFNLDEKFEEDV